jgi:hypothetical protein
LDFLTPQSGIYNNDDKLDDDEVLAKRLEIQLVRYGSKYGVTYVIKKF